MLSPRSIRAALAAKWVELAKSLAADAVALCPPMPAGQEESEERANARHLAAVRSARAEVLRNCARELSALDE